MLLGGGGMFPLELPLDPVLWPPCWHGCTAMASVSEPFGMMTSLEPGGAFVVPDCTVCASEHGGTTIVRSLRCSRHEHDAHARASRARWPIGSEDELYELLLLPQAVSPRASKPSPAPMPARRARLIPLDMLPPVCRMKSPR